VLPEKTSYEHCYESLRRAPGTRNARHANVTGGSFDIGVNSSNCGKCWQLTNSRESIYFYAIDTADSGFKVSKHVITDLSDGPVDPPILYVDAKSVAPNFCGFGWVN
jgi:hypothetical protein